jgi:hypothetical protein
VGGRPVGSLVVRRNSETLHGLFAMSSSTNSPLKHVHVTGCGRSGTTLLVEMMRSSFRCDGPSHHETSILKTPPRGFSVYITKHPGEAAFLQPLLEVDPNLNGIYIYRDPRSVICSVHAKATNHYAVNFSSWKKEQMHARRLGSHPRFLEVRYERLVVAPKEVQAEIMQCFPFLEPTGCFSSYQHRAEPSRDAVQALNGLREVDSDRLEPWRHHLPRVKDQLMRHPEMADLLVDLGYEVDTSWTGCLREVEACRGQAWESKGMYLLKKFDRWQRRQRRLRKRLALLQATDSEAGADS